MDKLRVIVEVRREGDQAGQDLEVPAEIPIWQLANWLATALNWLAPESNYSYSLVAELPRQVQLDSYTTLAEAGIWTGARLQLRRRRIDYQPAFFRSLATGTDYLIRFANVQLGRGNNSHPLQPGFIDLKEEPEGNTVSRDHACTRFENGKWILVISPKSKWRSYRNDQELERDKPFRLQDGDVIKLGQVALQFHLDTTTGNNNP